jgi:hypothetical protein
MKEPININHKVRFICHLYLSAAYIMDILFSEVDFSNLVTI